MNDVLYQFEYDERGKVAFVGAKPKFSLGQLYNKNLFYLGYVPEVLHFCRSVLAGKPPEKGTLTDVRRILGLFELYRRTPPGTAAAPTQGGDR
jgi:hypothetical protein